MSKFINYEHGGLIGYCHWEGEERLLEDFEYLVELLNKYPHYKTGIDAEAYTYEDPQIQRAIKKLLTSYKGRFDLIGGTYGQPLLWSIHPESIIRQFQIGLTTIRDTLDSQVEYYGNSEQTYFPQLAQILSLFNYKGVVLRNHFTMYGFCEPSDKPHFRWVSPCEKHLIDSIPTYKPQYFPDKDFGGTTKDNWCLTRYNSELFNRLDPSKELFTRYLEDLASEGILEPIFSRIDDYELLSEDFLDTYTNIEFVTAAEAFSQIDIKDKVFLQPDQFKTRLGWGIFGNEQFKKERRAVEKLLALEALHSILVTSKIDFSDCELALLRGWKNTLCAQHHDLNVVPTSRSLEGELLRDISLDLHNSSIHRAELFSNRLLSLIGFPVIQTDSAARLKRLVIFNPTGLTRKETISIKLDMANNSGSISLLDVHGDLVKFSLLEDQCFSNGLSYSLFLSLDIEAYGVSCFYVEHNAMGTESVAKNKSVIRHDLQSAIMPSLTHSVGKFTFLVDKNKLHINDGMLSVTPYFSAFIDDEHCISKLQYTLTHADDNCLRILGEGSIGDIPLLVIFTHCKNAESIDIDVNISFKGEKVGGFDDMSIQPSLVRHPEFHHDTKLKMHFKTNLVSPKCVTQSPFYTHESEQKNVDAYYFAGLRESNTTFVVFNSGDQGYVIDGDDISVVLAYSGKAVWELEKNCESAYLNGEVNAKLRISTYHSVDNYSRLAEDSIRYNQPLVYCIADEIYSADEKTSHSDIRSLKVKCHTGHCLVSSLRRTQQTFYFRVYETQGKPCTATVLGDTIVVNEVDMMSEILLAKQKSFKLEPWEIKNFSVSMLNK
ncbi:MAG: hypothetical protein ACJAYF_001290 [Arenicella sp.]|jgi:hypothetical protein